MRAQMRLTAIGICKSNWSTLYMFRLLQPNQSQNPPHIRASNSHGLRHNQVPDTHSEWPFLNRMPLLRMLEPQEAGKTRCFSSQCAHRRRDATCVGLIAASNEDSCSSNDPRMLIISAVMVSLRARLSFTNADFITRRSTSMAPIVPTTDASLLIG
jgi:hypothetical protein